MTIHSMYDPAALDEIWDTFSDPKDNEEVAGEYDYYEDEDYSQHDEVR